MTSLETLKARVVDIVHDGGELERSLDLIVGRISTEEHNRLYHAILEKISVALTEAWEGGRKVERDLARQTNVEAFEAGAKEGREEERKAFGGCLKCYGKGYATQITRLVGSEDFGGDGFEEPPKVRMNFCSCERGEQLAALTQQEK